MQLPQFPSLVQRRRSAQSSVHKHSPARLELPLAINLQSFPDHWRHQANMHLTKMLRPSSPTTTQNVRSRKRPRKTLSQTKNQRKKKRSRSQKHEEEQKQSRLKPRKAGNKRSRRQLCSLRMKRGTRRNPKAKRTSHPKQTGQYLPHERGVEGGEETRDRFQPSLPKARAWTRRQKR